MCGIYGTVNIKVDKNEFIKQLNVLTHRGPDGFGVWQSPDSKVNLGHRRLAIIDTDSRSAQPMCFDNRHYIVFNGEIYNYIELRKRLEKNGIHFQTSSDTEVLLKWILYKGPEGLMELNGMWSFVIYDSEEDTLFLSRDRLGKKPLYYMDDKGQFAFSSQMKNLFHYLSAVEYNQKHIDFSVCNVQEHEHLESTLYRGIKKFPAGCYAFYKSGRLQIQRYYFPETLLQQKKAYKNFNEAVEQFDELFRSSCMLRLRSDVKIGSALSGGIDSSFVVSTIAKLGFNQANKYLALISSFPGSFLDETADGMMVSRNAGVPVEPIIVQPDIDPNHILQAVYHFEEIAGTSPIPFFQLYRGFRAKSVLVSLDGHGSDELFGGYTFDLYQKLKDDFPNILGMKNTLNSIQKMYGLTNTINLKKTWPHFKGELLNRLRKKELHTLLSKEQYYKAQLFHSTFKGILPSLLRNYDKYSMAAGVEIRMPFLDYRIVEFAFSLPNNFKLRNGFSKAIVRNAAKGLVPEAILSNKIKTGWNSPMGEWFAGPWKEWLLDETQSTDFKNCTLINSNEILTRINNFYTIDKQQHQAGQDIWIKLQPYLIEKANKQFDFGKKY